MTERRRSRWGSTSLLQLWLRVALVLLGIVFPSVARATEAEDLEAFSVARDSYSNSDYESARDSFHVLLERRPPISPLLAEAARKYYFATLLLTDRGEDAARELEQILRNNPDVQFPARDFSSVVLRVVTDTRERMRPELERIRSERAATAHAEEEARERRRQELLDLLSQERVTVRTSRALMFFPFGIGQFANGSYGLGALFASLESLSLATAVVGAVGIAGTNLPNRRPDFDTCHESTCTPFIVANVVGWSALGIAAIAGIVQANLAFRAERSEIRRRPVPPRVQQLVLTGGPTGDGVAVGVGFRF